MPLRRRRSHYQQLTEFEPGRLVGQREGGFSFRDIVERLGRNVSTVYDCWQQWSREGTASRRPGSGWPCDTTEREDRRVRRMTVAHGTASAAEIRAAVGTTRETTNCYKSVNSRAAPSQTPCSVHSPDSKSLPFAT
ncbi:hypothetical protein AVEN_143390-1 [Araneus ventricosus]|uniref:Transposase IS30-like HTH domain-containing protein n=1 Tax=Araneus ventricosus TaxID=182803 RepID=A0A4Y2AFU3_ARAVE|nr:hypothetical protein AVEN_143390-1 [Araneus ventricosus]